jgi:hypothetical protein
MTLDICAVTISITQAQLLRNIVQNSKVWPPAGEKEDSKGRFKVADEIQ